MPLASLSVVVKGMVARYGYRHGMPYSHAQANTDCPVAQKRSKTFKSWQWRWGSDDEYGRDRFVREDDLLAVVVGTDPFYLRVPDYSHLVTDNHSDFQFRDSQCKVADKTTKVGKIFFVQRFALQCNLSHLFSPTLLRVNETTAIAAIPSLRPTKPIWSVVVAFTLTKSVSISSNSAIRFLIASL